jgi:radical SAM protein with 4Fe4S-binding SPASM domain
MKQRKAVFFEPSLYKLLLKCNADGMVAPCQGMCETDVAESFPSLKEQSLSEILKDSAYVKYSYAKVGDVRRNSECGKCEYKDRCAGGCMVESMTEEGDFLVPDKRTCYFHKHIGADAVRKVADEVIKVYCVS